MKKEFRSSIGALIRAGVYIWFIAGVGLAILTVPGASLYTSLTGTTPGTAYNTASISAAILLAVMSALLLTVFYISVTVSVGPEEVIFKRGVTVLRRIPLEGNIFSSNIKSTYYNGVIKADTTRMLSVITNGVRKEYKCNGFTKDTFEQMIAVIQEAAMYANTPGISQTILSMKQETAPARTFTLPREDMIRVMSFKSLMLTLYGLIISALIVAACIAFTLGNWESSALPVSLGFVFFILFFVSLGFFLYHLVLHMNFKKHTPSAVTVDTNTIQIDGRVFNRSDIDSIKATAPEYAKSAYIPIRKIIVAGRFGRFEYWFGGDNIRSKRCVVFTEYHELYRSLGAFLLRDGKLLINDLQ